MKKHTYFFSIVKKINNQKGAGDIVLVDYLEG